MALSDITPIKRTEEFLQRIADAIESGGGSDLPAVTSDDNGDVLTVVNGAWDKAAASGGVPRFIPDQHTIQVPDEVNGGSRAFDPTSDQLHVFYNGSPDTIYGPAFNATLPDGLSYISETEDGATLIIIISEIGTLETSDIITDNSAYDPAFVYSNGGGTYLEFQRNNTITIIDPAKIKYCRCLPK